MLTVAIPARIVCFLSSHPSNEKIKKYRKAVKILCLIVPIILPRFKVHLFFLDQINHSN